MNTIKIDGYKAIIHYDSMADKLRGEFTSLNGSADFYAATIAELREEGKISLRVFFDICKEERLHPHKKYSRENH